MNVFEKIREKISDEGRFAVSLLNGKTDRYIAGFCDCTKKIIQIVNKVEQEHNNGWIACSERLPEDDTTHFVTFVENNVAKVTTGWYDEVDKMWYVGYFDYRTRDVTAWMPEPQPFKDK